MSKKIIVISLTVFLLTLVTIGGSVAWFFSQLQPADPGNMQSQQFVIPKGAALSTISGNLYQEGLIKQPQVFRYYTQFRKLDTAIQAGSYDLSPGMSTPEIAIALTEGTEDLWITIPEGWRREEIAVYLSEQELPQFDESEFLSISQGSEGQLFPDTYLIPRESTAEQIYSLLIGTYENKVVTGLASERATSELTPNEQLVLASIVEREGRGYEDMRHVAGILLNRLEIGMPLQADATLQYIEGEDEAGKWWSPPNVVTKQTDSPYNTYLYPGLPPQPITNPGLDAIKAVLDPIPSNDLFYIHSPSGQAYYAETLDEHNANVKKYLR